MERTDTKQAVTGTAGVESVGSRAERLLALQGWRGAELAQARATGVWQRLSPALCMTFTIVGTVLASPAILLALAATAVAGAVRPGHPFDVLYNHGIRHALGRPPIPPSRAARRSACALASVWLVTTALAFALDATTLGIVLGASLAAAAAAFTFAGFCIPSFVFNAVLGQERACRRDLGVALR